MSDPILTEFHLLLREHGWSPDGEVNGTYRWNREDRTEGIFTGGGQIYCDAGIQPWWRLWHFGKHGDFTPGLPEPLSHSVAELHRRLSCWPL